MSISNFRPVVKPNTPPDIEPINNLEMEGQLIKIGRIKGKTLWTEKTRDIPVSETRFEVRTAGLSRTHSERCRDRYV